MNSDTFIVNLPGIAKRLIYRQSTKVNNPNGGKEKQSVAAVKQQRYRKKIIADPSKCREHREKEKQRHCDYRDKV